MLGLSVWRTSLDHYLGLALWDQGQGPLKFYYFFFFFKDIVWSFGKIFYTFKIASKTEGRHASFLGSLDHIHPLITTLYIHCTWITLAKTNTCDGQGPLKFNYFLFFKDIVWSFGKLFCTFKIASKTEGRHASFLESLDHIHPLLHCTYNALGLH